MANVICVMGESGSGKTTAMRNLDPASTYYIDCDKKGLSWRGWKAAFNINAKNYWNCDEADKVLSLLRSINKGQLEKFKKGDDGKPVVAAVIDLSHIKTVVIDTLNGIMVADEMRRSKEKGYDKWADLAASVYGIIDYALTMRDDMTVIFLAHTQVDSDDDGYKLTHIKTNGKKLNKIGLETKFPIVLLTKCIDGEYVFETQANNSTAKSPMGMLEDKRIPNDITAVIQAAEAYYG